MTNAAERIDIRQHSKRPCLDIDGVLSHDRQKPTGKAELASRLGTTEREARRQIANARRQGVWVVSLLTGGYYITDNPEEWNAFCEQEQRRALATFKKAVEIPNAAGQRMKFCTSDALAVGGNVQCTCGTRATRKCCTCRNRG